jgi:hypothetical protein
MSVAGVLRWARAGLAGALVAGAVGGAGLAFTSDVPSQARDEHPAVPTVPAVAPVPAEGSVSTPDAEAAPAAVAEPVAVALPRLGVRSALDPLHLQPDGQLEAPPRWEVAGWYLGGPRPGERGPAAVAGHVDGPDGPAVFWRLEQVRRGDRIEVARADGTTAVFVVTRTLVVPKSGFPTEEVYGPTPHAELRLITCDGRFDRRTGHYVDNLIVFATGVFP